MTMTPEQIEARFQRIEAILASSAEHNIKGTGSLRKNMEILAVSMNRLAQSDLEYKRLKVETDQCFNNLLEEGAFNR